MESDKDEHRNPALMILVVCVMLLGYLIFNPAPKNTKAAESAPCAH